MDALLNPNDATLAAFGVYFIVATVGCAVGSVLFVISYGFFFNWRMTAAGRTIMYLMLSLSATFVLVVLSRVFGPGDYPGRTLITAITYTTVLVTIWRLLITLWRHYNESGGIHVDRRDRLSRGVSVPTERPDTLSP